MSNVLLDGFKNGSHPLSGVTCLCVFHNHDRYIIKRLWSILDQTRPPEFLVIIINEASDEGIKAIYQVASQQSNDHSTRITIHLNPEPLSLFENLSKWIVELSTERIWIAEGDDECDREFLAKLLATNSSSKPALLISDSSVIDSESKVIQANFSDWYRRQNLYQDLLSGDNPKKILEVLKVINIFPNLSAVIWPRKILQTIIAEAETVWVGCYLDWLLYFGFLKREGALIFISDPLNGYRRHKGSYSMSLSLAEKLTETKNVYTYFDSLEPASDNIVTERKKYLSSLS